MTYDKQTASYHSNTWQLAKMAQKLNVKRLILTHLVPAIPTTPAIKNAFKAGMNKYYSGPIIVADDRDQIILSSDGKGHCKVQYIHAKQPTIKVYPIK